MARPRSRFTPLFLSLLVASACADDGTGPEVAGLCVGVVNVEGVVYTWSGEADEGFEPGAVVATVQRFVGCNDVIVDDGEGGRDGGDFSIDAGDSNVLPAGTTLHVVPGQDPAKVLAAHYGERWYHFSVDGSGEGGGA